LFASRLEVRFPFFWSNFINQFSCSSDTSFQDIKQEENTLRAKFMPAQTADSKLFDRNANFPFSTA